MHFFHLLLWCRTRADTHDLAKRGDVRGLRAALRRSPDATTCRDDHGRLPLHYAQSAEARQILCKDVFFPWSADEEDDDAITMV